MNTTGYVGAREGLGNYYPISQWPRTHWQGNLNPATSAKLNRQAGWTARSDPNAYAIRGRKRSTRQLERPSWTSQYGRGRKKVSKGSTLHNVAQDRLPQKKRRARRTARQKGGSSLLGDILGGVGAKLLPKAYNSFKENFDIVPKRRK